MATSRYPVWPISPEDEGRLWLRWLVILRWVAIVAQTLTVAAMIRVLDGPWASDVGGAMRAAIVRFTDGRTAAVPLANLEVTEVGRGR